MRTSDARPPYQVECSMPNTKGTTSIQSPLHPNNCMHVSCTQLRQPNSRGGVCYYGSWA